MPGRPRADSMPSPGEQTDRRIANTELSRFASLDSHRGRPSRTLEALDLATPHSAGPRSSPRSLQGNAHLPTFKAIASQMKEAGKHTLDPHLLAGALGVKGGKRDKLAAEIQKRMQGHQDKQAAFLNQFKNKGFAGLHEMPGAAMKGANKQLSAFLEHKGKKK
jgi:hypothetical protein